MDDRVRTTIRILERLVSFQTLPGQTNLDFIHHIRDLLDWEGLPSHLSFDDSGQRANIHTLIGPRVDGGVVLNGHTDVVPVEGQDWKSDPFVLREKGGKLFGRGAVDMKGFLACMLASIPYWKGCALTRPIHLSFCFDEEIGGFGAPILVDDLLTVGPKPAIAIIGEPTEMQIVTAHKGSFEMRTEVTGFEAHSADPRKGVSAVQYASRIIDHLYMRAENLESAPRKGSAFDPPYSTINVGTMNGGAARNIVSGSCVFEWDFRPLPGESGQEFVDSIIAFTQDELLPEMRRKNPASGIHFEIQAEVPPLADSQSEAAVTFVREITGHNRTHAVPFGTDGGHFAMTGISTIVMGPGCIDQAHKPDEYIEAKQLEQCLKFFHDLGERLEH